MKTQRYAVRRTYLAQQRLPACRCTANERVRRSWHRGGLRTEPQRFLHIHPTAACTISGYFVKVPSDDFKLQGE